MYIYSTYSVGMYVLTLQEATMIPMILILTIIY